MFDLPPIYYSLHAAAPSLYGVSFCFVSLFSCISGKRNHRLRNVAVCILVYAMVVSYLSAILLPSSYFSRDALPSLSSILPLWQRLSTSIVAIAGSGDVHPSALHVMTW